MKVSEAGINLIKEFEGFPFGGRPYQDSVRVWTIGYGHTEGVGPNSARLTQAQALDLLHKDLDKKYAPFVAALGLPLNQHQFDALVSFVYNLGPGAIGSDTGVGKALRAKNWHAAADELLKWDRAGSQTLAGLTRRRHAERALFLESDDPLAGYPDNEKRWIHEYDALVRSGKDAHRRGVLKRVMAEQRQKIWRVARPKAQGGDGHGWDYNHRRQRYRSLQARSS